MNENRSYNLAQIRKIGLERFEEVAQLLNEYKIPFWLDFGTMLGAVRDGNPIPWDGEFDISSFDEYLGVNNPVWEKITKLGYQLLRTDNNIKIYKKNDNIGRFLIDIHRYKKLEDRRVYYYGNQPNSYTNQVLLKILNIIESRLNENKNSVIMFAELYKHLRVVANSDNVDLIEFHIQYNNYYQMPFSIICNEERYTPTRNFGKSKLTAYTQKIIEKLPNIILTIVYDYLSNAALLYDYHHISKFEVAPKFFNKFKKISFGTKKYLIPYNSELYLENIYGSTWRTPKVRWESSRDSNAFSKS